MRSPPSILVFDSGLGGLTVLREIERHGPTRRSPMWPMTHSFLTGRSEEATLVARVVRADRHADRRASRSRPRGHRLQHRVDPGAAASARALHACRSSAPCRQSNRPAPPRRPSASSVLGHPGDGEARIYPCADPRFRPRLRRHAGRLGAARRHCRGRAARRAGRRMRRSRPRSRPALSTRRPAHRHDRARLHALSRCCSRG